MSPLRSSQGLPHTSALPPPITSSALRPIQPISHLERLHAEEAVRSLSPPRLSMSAAVLGSPRPAEPISHAERLHAEETACAMSPFRVSDRASPRHSPCVSPRSRSIGSIFQAPQDTLLRSPPSPKSRPSVGSPKPLASKSLLVQDQGISLKLLQKERDQTNAEDVRFFGEVAEHIDLLQLDVARHKKRHMDTEDIRCVWLMDPCLLREDADSVTHEMWI